MKILLETPEEEKAMRVPEIHLAGLVEAIKTNGLYDRSSGLPKNKRKLFFGTTLNVYMILKK